MRAPRRLAVLAVCAALALFCAVSAVPLRAVSSPAIVGGLHAETVQIGPHADQAASLLIGDADGDGLLDALVLPIAAAVTLRLAPLWPRARRQADMLTGRAILPLSPPPRFG